ncbi:MAG: YcjX family protein [Hyphomicrobium sp.]
MNFTQIANATGLYAPALRLGVTGLSRAGKTVFITSLVRNLTAGGRLPFFAVQSQGRLTSAFLQPQPDDDVPRFDYEAHLAALDGQPPHWPASTRQISQLRVALAFTPQSRLRYLPSAARLNVDIVDYPGEWLLDLALLDQSYPDWSAATLATLEAPAHRAAAAAFVGFLDALDAGQADAEPTAIEGARLYTAALTQTRAAGSGVATLGPGRFLLPGDAAGSPMLTFFPLPASAGTGPLRTLLEKRYRSYCERIVRPFFRSHFSRLDRQIVLIDVLGALNDGPAALADLERALSGVLTAFRPGTNTWLSSLFRPRIDRLLFAATKADHLHHSSHDRLEAILKLLVQRAMARATGAGAAVGTVALAAVRSTREAEVQHGGERLPCIIGVPSAGERIDGEVYDGVREAALFPGDLPADPAAALDPAGPWAGPGAAAFVRFRPPAMRSKALAGQPQVPPHIRLDRALEFLIGDWLR